jgi:junctophilin
MNGWWMREVMSPLFSFFSIFKKKKNAGTYQGQWLRGLRHGYGVRTSAPFGMASRFRPKTNNVRSSTTSLKSDAAASAAAAAGGHHGHHHQSGSNSSGGGSGAHQVHSGGSLDPAADRDKRLDDGRGGFVLKARSDEPPVRRRSFSERSSTIKKSLFQVRFIINLLIFKINDFNQ